MFNPLMVWVSGGIPLINVSVLLNLSIIHCFAKSTERFIELKQERNSEYQWGEQAVHEPENLTDIYIFHRLHQHQVH
jgi:hypothetical protein